MSTLQEVEEVFKKNESIQEKIKVLNSFSSILKEKEEVYKLENGEDTNREEYEIGSLLQEIHDVDFISNVKIWRLTLLVNSMDDSSRGRRNKSKTGIHMFHFKLYSPMFTIGLFDHGYDTRHGCYLF
jgi:hypothetical protein